MKIGERVKEPFSQVLISTSLVLGFVGFFVMAVVGCFEDRWGQVCGGGMVIFWIVCFFVGPFFKNLEVC